MSPGKIGGVKPGCFHLSFLALLLFSITWVHTTKAQPMITPMEKPRADSILALLAKGGADTVHVNRLLLIGQYHLFKPSEEAADLDSALVFYKKALALARKLHYKEGEIGCFYLLGNIQSERQEVDKADRTIKQVINLCKKYGFTYLEALGWHYLGQVYIITDATIPDKISYYKNAIALFERLGMIEYQGYLWRTIAELNFSAGNVELALTDGHKALKIYQSLKSRHLHRTYELLSEVNRVKGNYQNALKFNLAAIEEVRSTEDSVWLDRYYQGIGFIYDQLDDYQGAIKYRKLLLDKYLDKKDTNFVLGLTRVIFFNYLKLGSTEEAIGFFKRMIRIVPPHDQFGRNQVSHIMLKYHALKKEYAKAEKHLISILDYETKNQYYTAEKVDLYQYAADFYIEAGRYEKAREYMKLVLDWNKTHGPSIMYASLSMNRAMFKIDSAQGNYKSAIAYYQRYKSLNDSIFNETKSKQIANLEIEYSTKEKEQHIALLRKTNQAQQASIREKDFQRNAFFAGSVMLAFLLLLSYNQYKNKKRSNAQLEAKQVEINEKNIRQQRLIEEKEWLLKEIHHRVKNNLQTVMSLLESQSAYLKNDALAAVKDSQHRVHAMSLIHQKLYLSDNVTTINMPIYIQELVSYLRDSFDIRQQVSFQLDLEPIDLDVAQAIPVGLILNEAITNSIKYAFPDHRPGVISVTLRRHAFGQIQLTISDDGIGLPSDFEGHSHTSLGMRLMRGLSNEIGGELYISNVSGTSISISLSMGELFRSANTAQALWN